MANILDNLNLDREEMFLQDYESPVGSTLRSKFELFLENDKQVYNYFKSVPGIWEQRWFNDANAPGYAAGEFFWLNVYPVKTFIATFHSNIKEYIDVKASHPLPVYDNTKETYDIYYNALTGYTEPNFVKPYDPLFEIGDSSKRIQLAVSLIDDNKTTMDNEQCWKKFFVNEDAMISRLSGNIDKAIEDALIEHLSAYHLNGMTRRNVDVKKYMDEDYKNALSTDAFYHVRQYLRKPYYLSNDILNNTATYCAYKEWTNGVLEHFGTICTDDSRFNTGNNIIIPFNWNLNGGNTYALLEKELANNQNSVLSVNEISAQNITGARDNLMNLIVENKTYRDFNYSTTAPIFKNSSYFVTLTPIQGEIDKNLEDNDKPKGLGYLPVESSKTNKNFFSVEVNWQQSNESRIVLKNTGRNIPKYISYYVSGKSKLYG